MSPGGFDSVGTGEPGRTPGGDDVPGEETGERADGFDPDEQAPAASTTPIATAQTITE